MVAVRLGSHAALRHVVRHSARCLCCLRTRAGTAHPAFLSRAARFVVLAVPVARPGHCLRWPRMPPYVAPPLPAAHLAASSATFVVALLAGLGTFRLVEPPLLRPSYRLSFDGLWRPFTAAAMFVWRRVVSLLRLTHRPALSSDVRRIAEHRKPRRVSTPD